MHAVVGRPVGTQRSTGWRFVPIDERPVVVHVLVKLRNEAAHVVLGGREMMLSRWDD